MHLTATQAKTPVAEEAPSANAETEHTFPGELSPDLVMGAGASLKVGSNFTETLAYLVKTIGPASFVNDEYTSYTWAAVWGDKCSSFAVRSKLEPGSVDILAGISPEPLEGSDAPDHSEGHPYLTPVVVSGVAYDRGLRDCRVLPE